MSLYRTLGGESELRGLIDRFYERMSELPEAATIRRMHPEDLSSSREKLFMFLSGWSGGPDLYRQVHGHPRLRARHLPFAIGNAERDAWLACMRAAMDDLGWPASVRAELLLALGQVADFMRNVTDPDERQGRRPLDRPDEA